MSPRMYASYLFKLPTPPPWKSTPPPPGSPYFFIFFDRGWRVAASLTFIFGSFLRDIEMWDCVETFDFFSSLQIGKLTLSMGAGGMVIIWNGLKYSTKYFFFLFKIS